MKRRWAWIGVVVVSRRSGRAWRSAGGRAGTKRSPRPPRPAYRMTCRPSSGAAEKNWPISPSIRTGGRTANELSPRVPKRATTSSIPKISTASLCPATNRFDAIKLIASELKKEPNKVGMLPYAIMEYYEKLTVGFYDYRKYAHQLRDPDEVPRLWWNPGPLHRRRRHAPPRHARVRWQTAGRWNGDAEGHSARVDSFPEKNGIMPEEVCRGLEAKKIDDVWEHVQKSIAESTRTGPEVLQIRRGWCVRQTDRGEPGLHPFPRPRGSPVDA